MTARLIIVSDPQRHRLMKVRDGEFVAERVAEFFDPMAARLAAEALSGDEAFMADLSAEEPF